MIPEELGTKVITNEQGGVSLASYPLDSGKEELFRVFVYDDASDCIGAIRTWNFTEKKEALKAAKELCERFNREKDHMKNLLRYSVRVHRFHGPDLRYRSGQPLFDSMKEYQ
tara:strand:- start:836 stop:1171 length:336 start_codon:yes stop_codon:yes gene_type:complete